MVEERRTARQMPSRGAAPLPSPRPRDLPRHSSCPTSGHGRFITSILRHPWADPQHRSPSIDTSMVLKPFMERRTDVTVIDSFSQFRICFLLNFAVISLCRSSAQKGCANKLYSVLKKKYQTTGRVLKNQKSNKTILLSVFSLFTFHEVWLHFLALLYGDWGLGISVLFDLKVEIIILIATNPWFSQTFKIYCFRIKRKLTKSIINWFDICLLLDSYQMPRQIFSSDHVRDPLLNPDIVIIRERQQAILKGLSKLRQVSKNLLDKCACVCVYIYWSKNYHIIIFSSISIIRFTFWALASTFVPFY